MVGLDLSGVKNLVDDWIVDEVEITRAGSVAAAVLNTTTGDLEGEATFLVYAHLGLLTPLSAMSPTELAHLQRVPDDTNATYRLLLPADAVAEPTTGDLVRCTVSNTTTPDPWLPRRRFRVAQLAEVSSFNVARVLYLEELSRSNVDVPPAAAGPVFSGYGPPPAPPPSTWPVGSKYLDLLTNDVYEVGTP